MSLIIAATDFSEVAENAVHYACDLAVAQGASLTVMHSYMIPVSFNDNPMPVIPMEEGREIAEGHMAAFIAKLRSTYPSLSIDSYISFGDITDALSEYTEDIKPWLIVVGNSSSEDESLWPGSNLVNELRYLSYTVMAVSQDTKYRAVKKICLACDIRRVDNLPGDRLVELIQKTGAALHVLNVDHNNKEFKSDTPIEAGALHEMLQSANPEYHYTDNADIEEGIKNFVAENEIDWLLVTPHKHGFFENLFHKSHTKAIVRMIHIPVIALHEKQGD